MLKSCALACCIAMLVPVAVLAATTPQINQPARATDMGPPTLLVPPSSIGIDLCLGEASGAYGSPMLAITLSAPQRDFVCSLLRQSKWAADRGHTDLADQIMCASRDWRRADALTDKRCK